MPLLLWFTHWKASRDARCSPSALATTVVTVDRRSFPLDSRKVVAIGHGIDMRALPLRRTREPGERLRVVALGRTSPAKGLETIARAAELAGVDLELRGPSLDRRGARRARAARGARRADRASRCRTPRSRTCSRGKDVLVNNMREGALDKVVYEAAATCMPVLASNTGFDDVLPPELRFARDDAADLADEAARARRRVDRERARPRAARAGRGAPLGRALGRRRARGGAAVIVLHVQKVAGISGSEAHLLSLLPDLKRARLGHPLPDAARARAGRVGVRARARGGGVPVDAIPMHTDVDPGTFVRVLAYLVDAPADDPAHAPRPRRRLRPDRRARSPACRSGSRPSTASTSSARGASSRSATGRSARSRTGRSRSRAASRATSSETEGFAEPDFEIVHYGIAAGPEPEPYAGDAPRFLCIGRLIPIKGHVVLLRAFRAVLDVRPDVRLDIAGRGVLEHGLKDLARELGLNDAVRFLGHVTPIQAAIEQSLAVVVPSLGEGFGMVALEAMERARPVIAASIGGLEDLVRDGETGLLVRPGDADSLAAAMLALATDPARAAAMGREARRRAIERFPEDRCTERTEEVYRYLLARPRAAARAAAANAA